MERILVVFRQYTLPVILGGLSLLAIITAIVLLLSSTEPQAPVQFSSDASGSAVLGAFEIKVDIEGAVAHPGLYSLPDGSRVEDAIVVAGGLTDDADEAYIGKSVNRAMRLVDGAKLFIPTSDSGGPQQAVSPQGEQGSGLISVNTASESELDTLPGVGPVTAKKIIDSRPFQMLEELVSKKAVGAALFEKIKTQISL